MPMISSSILSGIRIHSNKFKEIIAPYSRKKIGKIEILNSLTKKQIKQLSFYQNETTPEIIIKKLSSFASILSVKSLDIIKIAARETGSPIKYQTKDLDAALKFLRNLHILKTYERKEFRYQPKGRCLIIASANQPILLTIFTIASAILSGNKVSFRPSTRTPLAASKIIKMFFKAGIPTSQLNMLTSSNELTKQLIESKVFDMVLSFASNYVNTKIAQTCTLSGTEFYGENEGYDWIYVDKQLPFTISYTVDLIIKGILKHNGQMCDSVRGVIVDPEIYDNLKKVLVDRLSQTIIGDPLSPKSDLGALLINTNEGVNNILIAHKANAKLVDKNILKLFEITNLDTNLCQLAPFAPIVWIYKSSDINEIINKWNLVNPYRLSFSVYTSNKKIKAKFCEQILAGRINLNCEHTAINVFDPLGGIPKSGFGGPHYWFEKLTNRKYINYGKN